MRGVELGRQRRVIEEHVAAAKHLTAIRCTHPDPAVRTAALAVLSLFDWENPCFKLAEQVKDPLDCRVDDLGIVVQVGGPRHQVEVLAENVGIRRQSDIDFAGRKFFHHSLPISARAVTRYVASAFLSALGSLQGRGWLRRAAGFSRPSDAHKKPELVLDAERTQAFEQLLAYFTQLSSTSSPVLAPAAGCSCQEPSMRRLIARLMA